MSLLNMKNNLYFSSSVLSILRFHHLINSYDLIDEASESSFRLFIDFQMNYPKAHK